jgi:septal ring factor EnvC (AmiA/AmiB activator)
MSNRRVAKSHRLAQKKKIKTAKKSSPLDAVTAAGGHRAGAGKQISKKRLAPTRVRVVDGVTKKQRKRFSEIESLQKTKSRLMKQQVAERMVLKEHLRELEARKDRIRRGDSAKTERRELAKYIRQLKQEQQVKHASELQNVEAELQRLIDERDDVRAARAAAGMNEEDADWEDVEDGVDDIDEDELQRMFAHLTV